MYVICQYLYSLLGMINFSFFSSRCASLILQRMIRHRLCMEELVDNVMYRIFIYSYPVPLCKRPKYYKLGTSKTVRFPRQGTECLTKLPENVSKMHIPFLHRDFFFIAFLVSTDPWWQRDKISVLHTKDWTGEEWIFLQRVLL